MTKIGYNFKPEERENIKYRKGQDGSSYIHLGTYFYLTTISFITHLEAYLVTLP